MQVPKSGKSKRPEPDSRRNAVLATIIEEHLVTGEAVGSHVVSDRFAHATGWSSATIRNVMSELDDMGLLQQPHTSAGRIPTDRGYRYYVDNMLAAEPLTKIDVRTIESIGTAREIKNQPDRLMERASHVLAELSENVGIVVWPSIAENRLDHIRFVRLPDKRILVVMVSTAHLVHDKVIQVDQEFSQEELDRTARYLNSEFNGKTLLAIRTEIFALMKEEKALYDRLLRNAILLCETSLQGEDESIGGVYLDGTFKILTKPEFVANTDRLRALLQTFEEKSRLVKILNECVASESFGNVNVVIGRENPVTAMKRCAVITTSYDLGDNLAGTISVVGPTRIAYGRTMAVVNYLARFIERALSDELPPQ
jgi:heat-inducible transcriptional repressor